MSLTGEKPHPRGNVAVTVLASAAHADEEHRVSLRAIVAHMIEETARHAGHADILRERIDGATGL